jgi:hypothetical protein
MSDWARGRGAARRTAVRLVLVVCTAAGALAALVAHSAPAGAAGPGCQDGDIEVTTNADTGAGSLRAAFATASAVAGPSRVCVSTTVAGPIVLTTGEVLYNAATTPGLTIEGNGITVSGNNASRVINNDTPGSLTLHHVTITGGNTSSADGGGGVVSAGATNIIDSVIAGNTATTGGAVKLRTAGWVLTVTKSVIIDNISTAGVGGGLTTFGAVTVTGWRVSRNHAGTFGGGAAVSSGLTTVVNSTFDGNTAAEGGGAIDANNPVEVSNSTISGNTASRGDGGAVNGGFGGDVTITNSTLSDNTATGEPASQGGAIHQSSGNVTVTNSTISGNRAIGDMSQGGGIREFSGNVTLVYATVVENSAAEGDNIREASSVLTAFGSVVALGGTNCTGGTTTSNGFNFSDDSSCGFTAATDMQSAGDPALGALADNGGPTRTRLPQPGSPLIDAIATASCQADGAAGITTDQRGITRPQGSGCDIGAVEVEVPGPIPAGSTSAAPHAIPVTPKFTG